MGMSNVLRRLAARAAVPVFPVVGAGAREAVQDLALRPEVKLVDAPRPAGILLLAGRLPEPLSGAADAAHDAMSHPRCTVRWIPDGREGLVEMLVRAHRDLLDGALPSEPPLLPDEDPAPWRGVGPYGQGGSGMTGGVPYGRPMAERADDRDGLTLDQLPVKVGPLFRAFPPGLTLDLKLQGDVIQEVVVEANPFDSLDPADLAPSLRPFLLATVEPVPVAELELARARHHLRWLAEALRIHELPALGERVLRLARRVQPGDADSVRELARLLGRTGVLGWATRHVGVIGGEGLEQVGSGPVARAAGVATDARRADPTYRRLGFEPIVGEAGDASGRWRQRIAEAAQALDLAARAGDARTGGAGEVEAPGGALRPGHSAGGRLLGLLPELLVGMEWGEAVTTIVSLDLDLEETAAAARVTEALL